MRTSTGSIKVTKIIQKKSCLKGKRKYTNAKADNSEMDIFPIAITSAVIRLTVIMRPTPALEPPLAVPPSRTAV